MINQRSLLGLCLAFVATASLSLVGCGGGDDVSQIECGPNTTLEGDECVAEAPVVCGDDTELDPNDNTCYVTEEVCGANTAFSASEDRCVPTSEVCDAGTYYDDASGLCYPDANCQAGDVIVDGTCVSPAAALAADADVIAEGNTNPELGGTPAEITVASKGDQIIFAGTIDAPSDISGNGVLDQHIDVFTFEGNAGDWFEISVYSNGIPSPAFFVVQTDEEGNFERMSSVLSSRDKTRQVVLPEDDTYALVVLPEALVAGQAGLIGGDDWDYVGTLELLDDPTAGTHDFTAGNYAGTLGALTDHFLHVDQYGAGNTVLVNWAQAPTSAEPIVSAWASTTELIDESRGSDLAITVPESGEFYLVFDWFTSWSNFGLDFEVSLIELVNLEDGDTTEVTFTAEEGDVLEATQSHAGFSSVQIALLDSDDQELLEASVSTSGSNSVFRYIGLEAGEYTLVATNDSGATLEDLAIIPAVISPTIIADLDATYSGGPVAENRWGAQDYYLLETEEDAILLLTLTGSNFQSDTWGYSFYYALGNDRLGQIDDYVDSWESTNTMDIIAEANTPYVIRIGGDDTYFTGSFDYEITLEEIETLADGESVSVTETLADGDFAVVSQNNDSGATFDLTITDEADAVLEETTIDAGEELTFTELPEGDITFTFTNNSGGLIAGFAESVTIITPEVIADVTETVAEGDFVEISQTNDDGASVYFIITDDAGDLLEEGTLADGGSAEFAGLPAGELTFTFVNNTGESIDGFVEVVDVITPQVLNEVTEAVIEGDVVELSQINNEGVDVLFTITEDASGAVLAEGILEDDGFFRFIGLPAGDVTFTFLSVTVDPVTDFEEVVDIISPQVVTDFEATYSGTTWDGVYLPQQYYLVELSETTVMDVTLTRTGAGTETVSAGMGMHLIYGLGDELLEEAASNLTSDNLEETITFEFEANTPYIIRVGGTFSSLPWDYDYDLTFE